MGKGKTALLFAGQGSQYLVWEELYKVPRVPRVWKKQMKTLKWC